MARPPRQAGAGEIEITEEMIEAGVKALGDTVPLDVARPMLADEDIVIRIFEAMSRARAPE